jgi:hypothetical protein
MTELRIVLPDSLARDTSKAGLLTLKLVEARFARIAAALCDAGLGIRARPSEPLNGE